MSDSRARMNGDTHRALILTGDRNAHYLTWRDAIFGAIFGMPIVLDPTMPPGEIEIRTSEGKVRVVNIGENEPGA